MIDGGGVAAEARRVLAGNRRRGTSAWGGRRFDFVCPSPTRYPFQWSWDSAFHAIALLHVDPELAKQELRCLLQGLQPDGFMPHMLLWEKERHERALAEYLIRLRQPFFTATIQPPVLARALSRVYDATGDEAFLRETLPGVLRHFEWLARERDPDGDGLLAILQPDESGLDACAKYDALMGIPSSPASAVAPALKRGMSRLFEAYGSGEARLLFDRDLFVCEDVMVNSIYADGLDCLARLSGSAELAASAARTRKALVEKCWDPGRGAFWDLAGRDERPLETLTFTSLSPLILPQLDPAIAARLVDEHLLNPAEFWLEYPIATVAASEPSFEADYASGAIWRGPAWVNANWYLYWGLRDHGRRKEASELARRTLRMVELGGMREFFNPRTAEGYGATDFGWTCLVLDLIAAEEGQVPDKGTKARTQGRRAEGLVDTGTRPGADLS